MRSSVRTRLLVALFGTVLAGSSLSLAFAKDKNDKKSDEKAEKSDKKDDKKPGITPYDQAIIDAHKSFQAGLAGNAIDEAIGLYRKAIALDPTRPEGHLYLAGALYQKADYAGADEAAAAASNRAREKKEWANYQGKAMFISATAKEAAGKADEAKAAWTAYSTFAKENPDVQYPAGSGDAPPMAVKVFPSSAIERETKIDTYAKSKVEYAKVRELIEKRLKELGTPKP